MSELYQYIDGTNVVMLSLQDIARKEGISYGKLRKCHAKNSDVPMEDILLHLKRYKNQPYAKLYPVTVDENIEYLPMGLIAKMHDLKPETITMHLSRNPNDSLDQAVEKIKKNRINAEKSEKLKKTARKHGISVSLLSELTSKLEGKLNEEQIVALAIANDKANVFSEVLLNSKVGLRKENRGGRSVWIANYRDRDNNLRDMTLKEIAEIEGLKVNSLLRAVNRYGAQKSIYEIVEMMVEKVELSSLYDLAYVYGVDRRLFIHRVNKYKGKLPIDAIGKIAQQDQKRLKLNPRKKREQPLPKVKGLSLSRFGYTNGTSSKTVIRRYDAGIEPEYTIGRRAPTSFYEHDGITLSMSELSTMSGLNPSTIRRSLLENPDHTLPQHLRMSVDEFHARLEQLKLLWTLPSRQSYTSRTKLFTHGAMTFSCQQLCQIADVSESTIRRRSANTNDVFELTKLNRDDFLNRVSEIEDHYAKTLDLASLSKKFTEAQIQERNIKAIHKNYFSAIRERDSSKSEILNKGWSLLVNRIGVNRLSIAPCSMCLNAPDIETQGEEIKIRCPKCNHGSTSQFKDHIDAILDWSEINLATLTYSDFNCVPPINLRDLKVSERNVFLQLLIGYYSNELRAIEQLEAASAYPVNLRKRYDFYASKEKLSTATKTKTALRIVEILQKISMNSSLWNHIS